MELLEKDFWEMTLAELIRYCESFQRRIKLRQKQTAIDNYNLADLIGISISRIYNKNSKYPPIEDIYPDLFDKDVEKQNNRNELTKIRFIEFANQFNSKYKDGEK